LVIQIPLEDFSGIVADLALRLLTHLHGLIEEIDELTAELSRRIPALAPALLAIVGCGFLTAAKIPERSRRYAVPLEGRLRTP
jgi:transposase